MRWSTRRWNACANGRSGPSPIGSGCRRTRSWRRRDDDDLPGDAQRALKELPQARWSRQEMLYLVGTLDRPQTRADMRTPPDSAPGGGHEGEPEQP